MYVVADYASWENSIDFCTGLITLEEAVRVVRERGTAVIFSYISMDPRLRGRARETIEDRAISLYQCGKNMEGEFYSFTEGCMTGLKVGETFCKIYGFDGNNNSERLICACRIPEPICEIL